MVTDTGNVEFEVTPHGEDVPDPDFDYTLSKDENEGVYASIFLTGLAILYAKYNGKNPSYVLNNIDEDTTNLLKDWESHTTRLNDIYNVESGKTLLDRGILPENVNKAKVEYTIKDGVLEQKSTLRGIVDELRNGIRSKFHYLKNRAAQELFNVKSNFKKASKRLQRTVQNGYRTTVNKAKRAAQIFLYGNPQAYWITAGDSKVCGHCLFIERESPMPLSKMPYWPLHPHCGGRCRVVLEKDLDLTEEAVRLTYYDYER